MARTNRKRRTRTVSSKKRFSGTPGSKLGYSETSRNINTLRKIEAVMQEEDDII